MAKNALTEYEQQLINRHWKFYRELATGRRKPATPAQEHFVEVTLGHATATTAHEVAYIKFIRLRAAARDQEQNLRDPATEGPTEGWFTRDEWEKLRRRQRSDGL